MEKVQEVLNIKDLQKALELYRQDNKIDKVNELEIAIANRPVRNIISSLKCLHHK
jgi:hypothetical protein